MLSVHNVLSMMMTMQEMDCDDDYDSTMICIISSGGVTS